ncbi:hypothetical protein [Metallibacterium sp.]|jgi:hypothetical protein|uniref:hypothetical protein n=1 Tax=Metallibacterium sp. TaxID=2940281 RepID=UPI0026096C2B|nr:hypothetical protein [Metallibacterium sp.]
MYQRWWRTAIGIKVAAARAVSFASIRNTSLGWWRVALDRTPCGLAKPCEGESAALLGGYRLMRNDEVSPEAIREGGLGCVARQARSHPGVLLAVEGTTSVSYAHALAADLGATGSRREAKHRRLSGVHSGRLGQASGRQARGPKPAWMTHFNCVPTGFQ